jgi:hypothetical protein
MACAANGSPRMLAVRITAYAISLKIRAISGTPRTQRYRTRLANAVSDSASCSLDFESKLPTNAAGLRWLLRHRLDHRVQVHQYRGEVTELAHARAPIAGWVTG